MDIKQLLEQKLEQANKHLFEFENLCLEQISKYIQLKTDSAINTIDPNNLLQEIITIQNEIKSLKEKIKTIKDQLHIINNLNNSKFENVALEASLDLVNQNLNEFEEPWNLYVKQYIELMKNNNAIPSQETQDIFKKTMSLQYKIRHLQNRINAIENQILFATGSIQKEYTPEETQMLRELFESPLNNPINPESEKTDDLSQKM